MWILELDSGEYESICIFAKKSDDRDGWICLEGPGRKEQQVHMNDGWYRLVQLALPQNGTCRIRYKGVGLIQMYLSGGPDLVERGIRFLDSDSGGEMELGEWYDTPVRGQYHFNPFMSWVNDPDGLCWFKGYHRPFYQSSPFGQEWNDMYWGHAASRDLLHWIYMFYVLEPQPGLWRDKRYKGGAFSGSAQVEGEQMHLYLTRHHGPQEDGEETREWQIGAVCRDGIHVEKERPYIIEGPKGASFDFRDPKVQQVEGRDYMVLGPSLDDVSLILLYVWEGERRLLKGPLLQEHESGIRTFECPDFFELGGKYAAAGAWMCHRDEAGQYQMTRCYTNTFDGGRFKTEYQQWYDFGNSFYAVQSFEHSGRRIAIGWTSDFYGEYRVKPGGARGSFSLPRELHMEHGRLFTEPIKECCGLLKGHIFVVSGQIEKDGCGQEGNLTGNPTGNWAGNSTGNSSGNQADNQAVVPEIQGEHIPPVHVPGSSFFVKIKLGDDQDFLVTLTREGNDTLCLERKKGVTSLVSTREEVKETYFPSDVGGVRYAEIPMDRRVAEVYLDRGETVGTKLFYQDSTEGHLEADFSAGSLNCLEVWTIESIWNHKS